MKKIKLKMWGATWKKEVRRMYGIKKSQNPFVIAETPDERKDGVIKYIQVDCPLFIRKKDAEKFFFTNDWQVIPVIVEFED